MSMEFGDFLNNDNFSSNDSKTYGLYNWNIDYESRCSVEPIKMPTNASTFLIYDELCEIMKDNIINVIFNPPATIVFWLDGSKTVVKSKNEAFDPEKGLAMAIAKHYFGNKGNYYNQFKKWLPKKEGEII